MAYARISITLPRDLVKAADTRARGLDRSRSWLVAQALRAYLGRQAIVREPVPAPYSAPGLGEHRLQQLKADLALTPEQRVLAAAQTAELAKHVRPRQGAAGQRLLQFDRYEDYLTWKRIEDVW